MQLKINAGKVSTAIITCIVSVFMRELRAFSEMRGFRMTGVWPLRKIRGVYGSPLN
jgi:hypothetical protein